MITWKIRCLTKDLLEATARRIAWLVPRRVAYWCAIRVAAEATTGEYSHEHPDNVGMVTALDRFMRPA